MFNLFRRNKSEQPNRLLELMIQNHDRVTISHNGVVRLNLNNKAVQREIQKHVDKLKELEELDRVR